MATVLFVRIKTDLASEEMGRRLLERKTRYLEVPGLIQKVYEVLYPLRPDLGQYPNKVKEVEVIVNL